MDVEGAELQVLESIDFTKTAFGVVVVEIQKYDILKGAGIVAFLERKGYRFKLYDQRNGWFVSNHFDILYKKHIVSKSMKAF